MYIDEGIFDALLLSSHLTVEDLKGFNFKQATGKPTFKPDKTKGEGKPSKNELDYRSILMTPFKEPTKQIKDEITSIKDIDILKSNIHSILTPLKNNPEKDIILTKFNTDAITLANNNLEITEKNIKQIVNSQNKYNPNQALLIAPLLLQQQNNLNNIVDSTEYNLNQGLDMCTIQKTKNKDFVCPDDYVDQSFNQTQNRLDTMGWYGYRQSDQLGTLAVYGMGAVVLGNLVADWLTCEDMGNCSSDSPVCDDCLDMAANGPYSVLNWPDDLHPWDRCGMGIPYLQ